MLACMLPSVLHAICTSIQRSHPSPGKDAGAVVPLPTLGLAPLPLQCAHGLIPIPCSCKVRINVRLALPPSMPRGTQHAHRRTCVSCSRVAAAPVGLLGEQKKMMSVRLACRVTHERRGVGTETGEGWRAARDPYASVSATHHLCRAVGPPPNVRGITYPRHDGAETEGPNGCRPAPTPTPKPCLASYRLPHKPPTDHRPPARLSRRLAYTFVSTPALRPPAPTQCPGVMPRPGAHGSPAPCPATSVCLPCNPQLLTLPRSLAHSQGGPSLAPFQVFPPTTSAPCRTARPTAAPPTPHPHLVQSSQRRRRKPQPATHLGSNTLRCLHLCVRASNAVLPQPTPQVTVHQLASHADLLGPSCAQHCPAHRAEVGPKYS